MRDVVTTSAVFFSYALLAVFAQNAVFTRALGVSRLVQLVGDDRTSSWLFGMQLCITQVLVTPFAWYAGSRIAPLANRAQLRPLVYIASIAVVCVLEHAVLWLAKGLPHRSALLRIVPLAEARHRLRSKAIPEAFRGLPITLVYIGVLALAIYGFTGHSVIL